jgi:hypothetical protein
MPRPPFAYKVPGIDLAQAVRLKPARGFFSVSDDYWPILNVLYAGVQRTALWERLRGSCFCAAGFVAMAFTALGRQARVLPCYADVDRDNSHFLLGYPRQSCAPEQVDAHVVTLVDERVLVDFGLRNVQRYAWPDFPGAVALNVAPGAVFPAELVIGIQRKISWRNDWENPETGKIMADHRLVIEALYGQFSALTGEAGQKTSATQ